MTNIKCLAHYFVQKPFTIKLLCVSTHKLNFRVKRIMYTVTDNIDFEKWKLLHHGKIIMPHVVQVAILNFVEIYPVTPYEEPVNYTRAKTWQIILILEYKKPSKL